MLFIGFHLYLLFSPLPKYLDYSCCFSLLTIYSFLIWNVSSASVSQVTSNFHTNKLVLMLLFSQGIWSRTVLGVSGKLTMFFSFLKTTYNREFSTYVFVGRIIVILLKKLLFLPLINLHLFCPVIAGMKAKLNRWAMPGGWKNLVEMLTSFTKFTHQIWKHCTLNQNLIWNPRCCFTYKIAYLKQTSANQIYHYSKQVGIPIT